MPTTARKSANLSLDPELVLAAKELKINISRVAEEGLRKAVSEARAAAWKAENAEAIESFNQYVEEHGLPLAKYRQF